ncbi:MAG: Uma2 family endonuclease [Chloroflexota bacterium]
MEAHAYPSNAVAPWAEVVRGAGPCTVEELLRLPDDGWQYEVVEGVLVRMAGSSSEATALAMRLGSRLTIFVEDHDLGVVTGADGVYDFERRGQKNTGLIPDVGFYHGWRQPLVDPDKAMPFAPDLAVEVVSHSQGRREFAAKALRYLAGGTALVWVVWPKARTVEVWHAGDRQPSTTLGIEDSFDGEDVVPGFSYPLAALFRP